MTCPKCGKTDCADSPCARCGHYLQFAPTTGSALDELKARFVDEEARAKTRIVSYRKHGHDDARRYTEGQLDAFQAVLKWIDEVQNSQF